MRSATSEPAVRPFREEEAEGPMADTPRGEPAVRLSPDGSVGRSPIMEGPEPISSYAEYYYRLLEEIDISFTDHILEEFIEVEGNSEMMEEKRTPAFNYLKSTISGKNVDLPLGYN